MCVCVVTVTLFACRSRHLLEESSDACSSGDTTSLFSASNSSSGEVTVAGSTVCGVGDNEVIYDIGTVDSNGNFIPSVLNAHSEVVTVQAGPPSCFQLVVATSRLEQTLSAIRSSIFVQLMDSGRNVSIDAFVYCVHQIYKPSLACSVCQWKLQLFLDLPEHINSHCCHTFHDNCCI